MKRHSDSLLFCAAILLVATIPPGSTMAQRFGDGQALRRMFGLDSAKAADPAPQPTKAPPATRTPPSNKRPPTNPYARPSSNPYARSPGSPYSLSPSRNGGQRPTQPRSLPPRVNVVPVPRPPSSPSAATRNQAAREQNAYATRRQMPPQSRRPTPAPTRHPTSTTQRPSAPPTRRPTELPTPDPTRVSEETTEEQDDRKIVEHEAFGVTVKMRGERLIVSRVQKSGTAGSAGIESGDTLLSVGEIPMKRPSDIEQLDDVLSAGDQVEFEIVHKGKTSKTLVAFMREVALEEPTIIADTKTADASPTLVPTPRLDDTKRSTNGYGASEESPQVIELRRQVQSQQQIIDRLQSRLSQLEQASQTPMRKAPTSEASQQSPILLLPPTG